MDKNNDSKDASNEASKDVKKSGINYFLELCYFILFGLSSYSIYVIFDEFVNNPLVNQAASTPGVSGVTDIKKDMEMVSVIISALYVLISFTSLYLIIVFFRFNHMKGDANHIICLVLNSFLILYGFVSVLPACLAAAAGAGSIIFVPIITSALSILLGTGMLIRYTF